MDFSSSLVAGDPAIPLATQRYPTVKRLSGLHVEERSIRTDKVEPSLVELFDFG